MKNEKRKMKKEKRKKKKEYNKLLIEQYRKCDNYFLNDLMIIKIILLMIL